MGIVGPLWAQQYSIDVWHTGTVVLEDSTVVEGDIKYNYDNNFIEVKDEYAMKIVAANQLLEVKFKDNILSITRTIKPYLYKKVSDYKTPVLFEPIVTGKIDLLCREAVGFSTYSPTPYGANPGMNMGMQMRTFRTINYQFYIRKQNGTVVLILNPKKQIKEIMQDKKEQIKEYIDKNDVRWNNKEDLIRLILFYNAL